MYFTDLYIFCLYIRTSSLYYVICKLSKYMYYDSQLFLYHNKLRLGTKKLVPGYFSRTSAVWNSTGRWNRRMRSAKHI